MGMDYQQCFQNFLVEADKYRASKQAELQAKHHDIDEMIYGLIQNHAGLTDDKRLKVWQLIQQCRHTYTQEMDVISAELKLESAIDASIVGQKKHEGDAEAKRRIAIETLVARYKHVLETHAEISAKDQRTLEGRLFVYQRHVNSFTGAYRVGLLRLLTEAFGGAMATYQNHLTHNYEFIVQSEEGVKKFSMTEPW